MVLQKIPLYYMKIKFKKNNTLFCGKYHIITRKIDTHYYNEKQCVNLSKIANCHFVLYLGYGHYRESYIHSIYTDPKVGQTF